MIRRRLHGHPDVNQELFEQVVRARQELVELGLVEACVLADGRPAWRMTKLGRERGQEILRAVERHGPGVTQ
jgi:hypothetical protein